MGNSASALPYKIEQETHSCQRPGSLGFSIHVGKRKSDGTRVTVFKGEKKGMAKTPLLEGTQTVYDPTMVQIFPALHHYQKIKTILHPNILKTHATLDTDFPNGEDSSGGGGDGKGGIKNGYNGSNDGMETNPASLSQLERTPTTGELIIVTEEVMPLTDYLELLGREVDISDEDRASLVAWGLHNVISALVFLHGTAKVCHGNLSPHAIYVTPAGDFKLSHFHLLTPIGIDDGAVGPTMHFKHFERDVLPKQFRSPERLEARWDAISNAATHAMDSFSFGVTLEQIYSHPACGTQGQLPDKLVKAVQRLKTSNLKMRPRLAPLLKCPIFHLPQVTNRLALDSISVMAVEERISFLQTLPDLFQRNIFHKYTAIHKVLPILTTSLRTTIQIDAALAQDIHRRECLAIVPAIFYLAEHFLQNGDDPHDIQNILSNNNNNKGPSDKGNNLNNSSKELFQTAMVPVIKTLFTVNDRAVRGQLLQKVKMLTKNLDAKTLNAHVFEPMCSGFTDSSPPLRELTLRSAIHLVPLLSSPNIEKLMRYLIRLQSDTENTIRTNAVIFVGKITKHLSDASRQKLILPAFVRAMKDDFTPCRLAALKAVMVCRQYFDTQELAKEVLPCVVPHLIDGARDVRSEAFHVVDEFMVVLRTNAEEMEDNKQSELTGMMANSQSNNSMSSMNMGVTHSNSYSNLPPTSAPPGATNSLKSNTNAPTSNPPTTSSSYFSSMTNWMSTSKSNLEQNTNVNPNANSNSTITENNTNNNVPNVENESSGNFSSSYNASSAYNSNQSTVSTSNHIVPKKVVPAPKFSSLSLSDANISSAPDKGWSDDDDDDDLNLDGNNFGNDDNNKFSINSNSKSLSSIGSGTNKSSTSIKIPEWTTSNDEDFMASFQKKPVSSSLSNTLSTRGRLSVPTSRAKTGASSLGASGLRMKKDHAVIPKKEKPVVTKLASDKISDGWDDF